MDDLENRMERVLNAAREGMTPSAADTERTRRVLLAATAGLAVGVGASTAAASTAAAATASASATVGTTGAAGAGAATATKATGLVAAISSWSLGTKVVTAVVVSASLGTMGVIANKTAPATNSPAITTPAAQLVKPRSATPSPGPVLVPPAAPAAPEVAPAVAAEPVARAAPRASAAAEKPLGPDPLAAELALIERARQSLKSGQPQQALSALSEHQTRFQHGVMSQERMALRALALCSLGDPKGREQAELFLAQNPGSPLATHLRSGCK